MSELLASLNDRQRAVAEHDEGPLLVLAGAGSGKTRAIVHRIAHLILERGVHPEQIMAVTFTNKAAGEMKERVRSLLPESEAAPTWISTFHSTCARILRYDGRRIGIPRSFTIYDDDDRKRMIKRVMGELGLAGSDYTPDECRGFIERARNYGWFPRQAHEAAVGRRQETLANVYQAYHEAMRANATLDFGDLLLATIQLLQDDKDTRGRYQYQFRYLMVDEFQDTNPAQYLLLRLLIDSPHNLTVVGDDDQSIYAWRGATVTNLLGFEEEFNQAQVIRLEQNYRSTQGILDLANAVISANHGRKRKTLWSDRGPGHAPRLFTARDDREEAQFVCEQIERLLRTDDRRYGDVAVFYRTNAQSRVYEEQLRRFAIPYVVLAGTSFYAREEIKDLLAYLRAAVNPGDVVAAQRIVNVPKRGVGQKSMARLVQLAELEQVPITRAIALLAEDRSVRLRGNARAALRELAELFAELQRSCDDMGPVRVAQWLLEAIHYKDHLLSKHPDNAVDRWDNVSELINAMAAYEDDVRRANDGTEPTVAGFLERAALVQMNDVDLNAGAVTLMTIHAAKGLEYPVVFLTGLEEGSIPLIRGGKPEPDDLEEERRLAYVAITRAEDRLFLTNCMNRRVFGTMTRRPYSRFLDEVPEGLFERDERSAGRGLRRSPSSGFARRRPARDSLDQREFPEPEDVVQQHVTYEVPPDGIRFTRPTQDDSELGSYVGRIASHRTFGRGRITHAEFSGSKIKLSIDFPGVGTKKVISKFVELI